MEWCRLHGNYYLDPALVRAGEAAELLFVRMLAYSAENETGGRVPRLALPMLAPTRTRARIEALLREGVVIDDGADVVLRSWERIQEAHDSAADRRRRDRERKAEKRRQERLPGLSADMEGDVSADSPRTVARTSAPSPRHKEVETEQKTSSSVTRKRATQAPDDFEITDAMRSWGREHAPLVTDPVAETRQFLDHARANGKTFKDWPAAWRTWMGNAQRFAAERGNVRPLPSRTPPPGTHPHRAHLWEQG